MRFALWEFNGWRFLFSALYILEDGASDEKGLQEVEGDLGILSEDFFDWETIFEGAKNDLKFFPELFIGDKFTLVNSCS